MAKFSAISWARASLGNLEVPYSLAGRAHAFVFDGHSVRISIPRFEVGPDFNPVGKSGRIATLSEWTSTDGLSSAWYQIACVEIEIDIPKALDAKAGTFDRPPNAFDLYSTAEQGANTAVTLEYSTRMWAAYQHWLRVCRWVTGQWLLGDPTASAKSGYPRLDYARIKRKNDLKDFWALGGYVHLLRTAKIGDGPWLQIQHALAAHAQPPAWITFLAQAADRIHAEDPTGALLSCAIACETVARAAYFTAAGSPPNEVVEDLMQRVAAQAVIDRWSALTGSGAKAPEVKKLHALFDQRNKVIHAGNIEDLTIAKVKTYFDAAITFVDVADKWYFEARSEVNFRVPLDVV